jgi:hypothetical protein
MLYNAENEPDILQEAGKIHNSLLDATMNSFYVENDRVVISITLFSPERPVKDEGWNFQNRQFGLGQLVQSPF